jgi:RNA polymerase sigma-70 factor (ECF subfamily)
VPRTDEELLAAISTGDERALADLYDRFGRVAYGLALRVVRDPALAQDAVQDAFLAAWRTGASFDSRRGKAQTWLLTLVHRRAVDIVRREDRRRTDQLADDVSAAASTATDEEAALREQRRTVQAALARLSPDQREALELAYYGGLTQAELAERLGIPIGTVKSRVFAGLARLRDLLGETDDLTRGTR